MKILHTADLHLGHKFLEQSQQDEQSQFLDWLLDYIGTENIDLLLISGDIFDTQNPSAATRSLYYNFLIALKQTTCKHVVITAGNHDAAATINAPKELLKALDIHVVGKAPSLENIQDEVFSIKVNNDKVIIGAVPFLRDQDIRSAMAGQQFEEMELKYKKALVEHYDAVAKYCDEINTEKDVIIAMGHLFAVGGSTSKSDSERSIYVGGLGDIGADDFSQLFNYVALGHLHKAQIIKKEHIRYSGSPYILSFSEVRHTKKVVVLSITDKKITTIEEVNVPKFRNILTVKGTVDEVLEELKTIPTPADELTPWVEVKLIGDEDPLQSTNRINELSANLDLLVLKISRGDRKPIMNKKALLDLQELKEITVEDAFESICKYQNIEIDDRPDLKDAFLEIFSGIEK